MPLKNVTRALVGDRIVGLQLAAARGSQLDHAETGILVSLAGDNESLSLKAPQKPAHEA